MTLGQDAVDEGREKLIDRVTLRLDEPLRVRIEREVNRRSARAGVAKLSVAEVVRALIGERLDAIEHGSPP